MSENAAVKADIREPLVITAYGKPAPKGSLRHVGRGRMVEQLAASAPWRATVAAAVRATAAGAPPLAGPVAVEAVLTVAKPAGAPKRRTSWPTTRSIGAIDKLCRNLFDALVDAGVLHDDAQVVSLTASKCYPMEGHGALDQPGALIRISQKATC